MLARARKKCFNSVRLNPYTAERRDVSENTPPEAQEISQGRGFCTPRPERLPEGEARGQSRGPRGAKSPHKGNLEGRGGCIFRYIPTRGSVRTFFHSRQGGIRSNTVRLQVCLVTTSVLLRRLDKSGCAWISVRLWITPGFL